MENGASQFPELIIVKLEAAKNSRRSNLWSNVWYAAFLLTEPTYIAVKPQT